MVTKEIYDHAIKIAKEAGTYLTGQFKQNITFTDKNQFDILAQVDVESEDLILSLINSKFPDHSILSEEKGIIEKGSEYNWIIDPVDGTVNFTHGIDEFCISIGVRYKDETIVAVIYNPIQDKLYSACKGQGAFLNDKKINVSSHSELNKMIVSTDNSSKIDRRTINIQLLSSLMQNFQQYRVFGSCALHLSRLSAGELDCYFKYGPNFWDVAAGILIAEEAGAKVTDFEGKNFNQNSKDLIISNGSKHLEITQLIRSALI